MEARTRARVLIYATSLTALMAVFFLIYPTQPAKASLSISPATLQAAVVPSVVISLTNLDRANNDVATLRENPVLDRAAQLKADDMAAKSYFAHVSPDGTTPLDWLKAAGYAYKDAGENLGLNYSESERVEAGWMNSPGHRANILRPQFTEIGVAVSYGTYEGFPAIFTVEMFGTPYVKPVAIAVATSTKTSKPLVFAPLSHAVATSTKAQASTPTLSLPAVFPLTTLFSSTTFPLATTSAIEAFHRTLDLGGPIIFLGTTTQGISATPPTRKAFLNTLTDNVVYVSHATTSWVMHLFAR